MPSRSPGLALQRAIYAALTGHADVIAAFAPDAPRVYDTVPAGPGGAVTAKFPYLTIGEDQIVGATNQNTDGSEVFAKVEVWSRATDWGEAKTLEGGVRSALDATLELQGHGVVTHTWQGSLPRKEPDGLTRRIICTVRYQTAPAFNTAAFS